MVTGYPVEAETAIVLIAAPPPPPAPPTPVAPGPGTCACAPPPPPPTTVTLIFVVVEGVVNVPGEVYTVMLEKPPAAAAAEVHVVPFDVNTLPDEPGATNCTADVPLPSRTLSAVRDVAPVPPEATGKVPVVNADVDVAYIAPPDVNDDNPVPPSTVVTGVATSIAGAVIPVVPSSVIAMFYS